jgi:hypothetical protein
VLPFRRPALPGQHHVGLRHHADRLAAIHHHHRVDFVLDHHLRHLPDGIVRRAGDDAAMHQVLDLGAVVGDRDRFGFGHAGQRFGHRVGVRGGVDIALRAGWGARNGDRRFAAGAQAEVGGTDQDGHVAVRVLVVVHEVVGTGHLVVGEGPRQARVEQAAQRQFVHLVGLLGVGEVRALQPLLPHPQVAQVDRGVVAGRAGADHDHAAGVADEDRGGDGGLAGVLEHDVRGALLAQHFPDRRAEGCARL